MRTTFVATLGAAGLGMLVAGCTVDRTVDRSGAPAGYAGAPVYATGGVVGYGRPATDYERAAMAGDDYCQEATASVRQAEARAAATGNFAAAARARDNASRGC